MKQTTHSIMALQIPYGKFNVKPNKYILIYDHRYMPWHRSKYVMTWSMDIANITAYLGMFSVFHTHVMHILDKILLCEALEVHRWDRHLALYTWTWYSDFIWNFRFKEVFKYSSYRSFSHFFEIVLITQKNCVDFKIKIPA